MTGATLENFRHALADAGRLSTDVLSSAVLRTRIRLAGLRYWLNTTGLPAASLLRQAATNDASALAGWLSAKGPVVGSAVARAANDIARRAALGGIRLPLQGRAHCAAILCLAFSAGLGAAFVARGGSTPPTEFDAVTGSAPIATEETAAGWMAFRGAVPPASDTASRWETGAGGLSTPGAAVVPPEDGVAAPGWSQRLAVPPAGTSPIGASQPAAVDGLRQVFFAPVPRPTLGAATSVAPASGGYAVQLAAGATRGDLMQLWQDLQARHRRLLANRAPVLVEGPQPGSLVRLRVDGFADKAAADDLCTALRRQRTSCIVIAQSA